MTEIVQIADYQVIPHRNADVVTADGLRVYPPNARLAVFVPFRTEALARTPHQPQLSVYPVH
jgi:hypothetical protein